MKNKGRYGKFLVTLLICYFLMAMVNGLTATNLMVDYDNSYVDGNLRPGDSGILQVVIINTGFWAARDVGIYIPETKYIKGGGFWRVGRIEAGAQETISRVIRIASDTPTGLYTLKVTLSYDGYDADGDVENDKQSSWEIPIRVYGTPNFQLSLEDVEFFKDVAKKLKLKGLTKAAARETSATLSSSCVTVIGSNKKYIGDLARDAEFNLEYQIKPASTGTCTLSISLGYSDVSGTSTKEELSLGIDVQPSDINFKIEDIAPDTLTYGCVRNLTIYLKNLGTSAARDVTAKINVSDPFTALKTSEKYLGDVAAGETKDVKFEILVDTSAEKRAYEIPLTLEYYDAGGVKKTVEKKIGMQISGKPELSLALELADPFTKGSSGEVSIEIINSAFVDVKFLTMRLIPTEDYSVVSTNDVYIGNLDSDDTDSEEFRIKLSKNVEEGQIFLTVELRYREEGSNQEYVETKAVPLTVLSSGAYGATKPSGALTAVISVVSLIVGGFVLVIVIWLLYRLLKVSITYLDQKIFRKK
jgi:hypothetical protein